MNFKNFTKTLFARTSGGHPERLSANYVLGQIYTRPCFIVAINVKQLTYTLPQVGLTQDAVRSTHMLATIRNATPTGEWLI